MIRAMTMSRACRFSVGNIFAPERCSSSMAIHALAGIAVIGPTVSEGAGSLIGHVFGSGQRDAGRKNQRRDRAGVLQKSDRFVDRGHALAGAKHCPAGQDEKVAAKMSTQLLEITGIDVRMLPRQVHFAHDRSPILGTARRFIRFGPRCASRKKRAKMTRARNGRTPFWKQPRCRSPHGDARFDTRHRRR